jgi:hypothetical protein
MSAIPTSTSVSESAVIRAPLSHVWHLIKIQDFSKFWSALSGSEYVKGASEETDIVKWTFKDGTVIEVKQEEHSVSSKTNHPSHSLAKRFVFIDSFASNTHSANSFLSTYNRASTTTSPTPSSPPSPP